MKDEETIDWREGFPQFFHWTRRTSSRRGHGKLRERGILFFVFFLGRGGE
jgi:hypothetical protein